MKFWFDTEFIEDGKTIDLISIGVVAEDGRTYYAESSDCDQTRASDWVIENVFPHLTGEYKSRIEIRADLIAFMGHEPEIWGYYADYDWVVLCQLFGRMIDLPPGWPMFCRDVKQLATSLGNPQLPAQKKEHHALADAQWTREAWLLLNAMTAPTTPQAQVSDVLLPCPFCGGAAERIDIEDEGSNFGGSCIACTKCGASSPVHFDRKENLDSSWNERTHHSNTCLPAAARKLFDYVGMRDFLEEPDHHPNEVWGIRKSDLLRLWHALSSTPPAQADVAALVEALEPFARISEIALESDGWSDSDELELICGDRIILERIKLSAFRRAAQSLARVRKEG